MLFVVIIVVAAAGPAVVVLIVVVSVVRGAGDGADGGSVRQLRRKTAGIFGLASSARKIVAVCFEWMGWSGAFGKFFCKYSGANAMKRWGHSGKTPSPFFIPTLRCFPGSLSPSRRNIRALRISNDLSDVVITPFIPESFHRRS